MPLTCCYGSERAILLEPVVPAKAATHFPASPAVPPWAAACDDTTTGGRVRITGLVVASRPWRHAARFQFRPAPVLAIFWRNFCPRPAGPAHSRTLCPGERSCLYVDCSPPA